MRTVIVDLDAQAPRRRGGHDRALIAALVAASGAFALAVWITRPAGPPNVQLAAPAEVAAVSSAAVPRGAPLYTLAFPARPENVELGTLPERLANEAAPAEWRRVITVRGYLGVASVEGPAVVSWSEGGVLYWLVSPTRSTDDLIRLADLLR